MSDLLLQVKFCPVFIFDAVDGHNINTIEMNTEGFFCYDGWKNYLYKHGEARQKIYKEQKFPYDVKKVSF